jgi:ATP-dependent Zn protease
MWLRRRYPAVFYLILLAGLLAFIFASYRTFATSPTGPAEKSLGDLLTALDNNQVVNGTFNAEGDQVDWTDNQGNRYRTFYPVGYQLVDYFFAHHVPIAVSPSRTSDIWLTVIVPNLILFFVVAAFLWYFIRRSGGKHAPAT